MVLSLQDEAPRGELVFLWPRWSLIAERSIKRPAWWQVQLQIPSPRRWLRI